MTFSAIKDPSAVEDYTIDWSATLNASSPVDTISTSSWTADNGVTVGSDANTTTTTTVFISGGTRGKYSNVVNTVVTTGGRTYERTISVLLQDE